MFSEIKWLFHYTLTFYFFVSDSIWKWHTIFVYYICGIEESKVIQENLCYIILYVNRNNCTVKNLFIVCLLFQKGMTTLRTPFINLFIIPFFRRLFSWKYFILYQFSTGLFCGRVFMLFYSSIKLYVGLFLILVWSLTCWSWPTNVTSVNVSAIARVSYFQR